MVVKKDTKKKVPKAVVIKEEARELDPGHAYALANEVAGVHQLQFIKKQPGKDGAMEVVTDGTTTEAVLGALIMRVSHLNKLLPSDFNTKTLEHLQCALGCLKNRTRDRNKRGVEGTHNE